MARPKAEQAGDQIAGERLRQDVLIAHRSVVIAARHLKLRLELAQLLLQIEEIRARLEVGIVLGQCHKLAECKRQGPFRLCAARNVVLRQRACSAAQTRYFVQHRALMSSVTFDGFNEIWNELGAPLELDIDPAPGLVCHLARPYQSVEGDYDVQDDRCSDE